MDKKGKKQDIESGRSKTLENRSGGKKTRM
jgi:hypothetical protein